MILFFCSSTVPLVCLFVFVFIFQSSLGGLMSSQLGDTKLKAFPWWLDRWNACIRFFFFLDFLPPCYRVFPSFKNKYTSKLNAECELRVTVMSLLLKEKEKKPFRVLTCRSGLLQPEITWGFNPTSLWPKPSILQNLPPTCYQTFSFFFLLTHKSVFQLMLWLK